MRMNPSDHHTLIRSYLSGRLNRGEIVASSATVIDAVLRHWTRHVEHRPPGRWCEDDVASWIYDLEVRATTRKSRLTKLRPYCRWLILDGHMTVDPTLRMARIRVPSPAPRDLTVDEVALLLRTVPDERARLIVILMAQMGLRCGDLARARVEDIDVRRQSLHVRAKGGGGDPTHWEPIPAEAWRTLRGYLSARGKVSGPMIRSYQPPHGALTASTVGKLVAGWMTDAGLKWGPWDGRSAHALRHSCAQHMIDGGADLGEVQAALGHRTRRSTEIYVRREPVGLRAAMEGRSYLDAA